ncbi:hypothetical protein BDK61_4635 [Haloarcula quadrata]|uniref:Uncharacterized protein n=1 Tax=Haloarcula quadrata TaxID=182779 RepID=A0A495QR76_9EURY|nr:hypothetical protein BDK61_4635 [Haloarcula quadrata]
MARHRGEVIAGDKRRDSLQQHDQLWNRFSVVTRTTETLEFYEATSDTKCGKTHIEPDRRSRNGESRDGTQP